MSQINNSDKGWTAELDQQAQAEWATLCSSLSPESVLIPWLDWVSHMAKSPGKRAELSSLALTMTEKLQAYLRDSQCALPGEDDKAGVERPVEDRRFNDPAWDQWPYNLLHQSFLLQQQWWEQATRDVWGVDQHHQDVLSFRVQQWLEIFSPGNWLLSNPLVLQKTRDEGGANLQRGLTHFLEDSVRQLNGQPPVGAEAYVVGETVAVTPGKVVLRNRLIELIQYRPTTDKVQPEPILFVPPWIMKYYVLDLSPHNSLIKYLVDQGFTVFCISWKNPGVEERDLGMDEYLELGFHAALDAVKAIVPGSKVHAVGYCIGGTLLSIAAAAMARDGTSEELASMSLLAAQTDFSEPGELKLFIDESQVSLLEAQMAQVGYLDGDQMSAAFQMLRSYDLLWSQLVNTYLLGERRPMIDLMAWNADSTRMPARMHSQYLRRLYLNNDLSEGRYLVNGSPISLTGLTLPVFGVGTVTDHVCPWPSVYKIHKLSPAEITFVLTTGGHNAGIVNEPGRPRRQYQVLTRPQGGVPLTTDEWAACAPTYQGSWWPEWLAWLQARSGKAIAPPDIGAPDQGYAVVADAPGDYVKER